MFLTCWCVPLTIMTGKSGRNSRRAGSPSSVKGRLRRILNIDKVYAAIGECGPQQLKYCILIFFGQLQAACQMVHNVIVGQRVDFFCRSKDDTTASAISSPSSPVSACNQHCDSYVYVGNWRTIVEEVCLHLIVCWEDGSTLNLIIKVIILYSFYEKSSKTTILKEKY